MEKRGIVDSHTPDVTDQLLKQATHTYVVTPQKHVEELDNDTTKRLAQTAADGIKKRS